jgi:hypothetical protein
MRLLSFDKSSKFRFVTASIEQNAMHLCIEATLFTTDAIATIIDWLTTQVTSAELTLSNTEFIRIYFTSEIDQSTINQLLIDLQPHLPPSILPSAIPVDAIANNAHFSIDASFRT